MSSILDALKKAERLRGLGNELIFRNAATDESARVLRVKTVVVVLFLLAVGSGVLLFSLRQDRSPERAAAKPVLEATTAPPREELPTNSTTSKGMRGGAAQDLLAQTRASPSPASQVSAASPADTGQAAWLSSLSEEFRASLPPLVVNIHVYSPEESQRILYINNRQARQGERIQAGVMVEEIVQDGVVLRYRGQRFKLPRPS